MKQWTVTLKVRGPVLTGASEIGAFGVDAPVARLPCGAPYLPGDHVIGKIRHAIEGFADAAAEVGRGDLPYGRVVETMFGGGGDEHEGWASRRHVFATDLIAESGWLRSRVEEERRPAPPGHAVTASEEQRVDEGRAGTVTRIAIDPYLDAAQERALQTVEAPWRNGAEVVFRGRLIISGLDEDVEETASVIAKALAWVTHMGGLRTIGFGRVLSATMEPFLPGWAIGAAAGARIGVALRFHTPLLVVQGQNRRNRYRSAHVLPGGALKGALAGFLAWETKAHPSDPFANASARYPLLTKRFGAIRATHLFPACIRGGVASLSDANLRTQATAAGRPLCKPRRSAVWTGEATARNMALTGALKGLASGNSLVAPRYPNDWKWHETRKELKASGWRPPETTLRVRTAIDPSRRAAMTERLFSYEMSSPERHVWVGTLDLGGVPEDERASLVSEIADLLAGGLPGVGRSQAFAEVHLCEPQDAAEAFEKVGDHYVMTLRTQVMLVDERLDYMAAISQLSSGALRCERAFAEHSYAGAGFMAQRYFAGEAYRPILLTEPGSVLVLSAVEGREGDAEKWLKAVAGRGLDIPRALLSTYGMDGMGDELWRVCPFLPANGYGEVFSDHENAWDRRPFNARDPSRIDG